METGQCAAGSGADRLLRYGNAWPPEAVLANHRRSRGLAHMGSAARSDHATPEQLRSDIDSGRTGDKVAFPDPAAAPLGTDEEAAGTPVSPHAAALARRLETARPHRKPPGPRAERAGYAWTMVGLIAAVAAAIVGAMVLR
ncbi:MAG TPA: hypothetical protein VFU97_22320 [Xanthobacteraceae bacterium]|jgi:hypothetical protein|nr:hypothetical protein [Xanthobacteraceae bacterium]